MAGTAERRDSSEDSDVIGRARATDVSMEPVISLVVEQAKRDIASACTELHIDPGKKKIPTYSYYGRVKLSTHEGNKSFGIPTDSGVAISNGSMNACMNAFIFLLLESHSYVFWQWGYCATISQPALLASYFFEALPARNKRCHLP
jgi:hypothetical protein